MRLLAIILGSIITYFILMGTVFFWGQGRIFTAYQHPFFEKSKSIQILPWSFETSIQANPDVIIWADVYATSHDTIMVGPWGENDKNLKSREEIVSLNRPLLTDLFQKFPERKFLLNVVSNTYEIDKQMIQIAKRRIEKKQIAFQSHFDIVLRALKQEFSDLPYGASQSDWLRMNIFRSLAPWENGLLGATPFRGDIYFSPLKWRKIPLIHQEIVTEMHRRQKHVLIGPIYNLSEFEQAKSLGADGFLYGNEQLYHQLNP